MRSRRILVAGLGNVFLGDDGFGVAVVERLLAENLPAGVTVADFGIRGMDLIYALTDGYDAAVLVDAVQRGGTPGTLYLIEPDAGGVPDPADLLINAHALDPERVLALVRSLDGRCRKVLLLGCEPASFGEALEGRMGLSGRVAAAVAPAVRRLARLVDELRAGTDTAHETFAEAAERRAT